MITKKKTKFDVETIANCLTDNATEEAGAVAFQTFRNEDVEISNDYKIPFHAICAVKVKTTTEEFEVEDDTCVTDEPPVPGEPYIEGADNTSIRQGTEFDLTEGVKAYDGDGNEIPFTVEPSEVDKCEVGQQTFTYSAEGVTKERVITVTQIANPTINGVTEPIEVVVDEEFDPLDGVTGEDGNGNEVEVAVEQIEPPSPYPYTLCTMGAAQIPALQNGETYTITPNIVWVTEPPHDNIHREIRVYGENVTYGGNTLSNPVGDGVLYYADDRFNIDFYIDYAFEGIDYGDESIGAIAYGDGMQALSWDSLRLEVIGE